MTQRADQMRNRRQLFAAPGSSHDRMVRFLGMFLPAAIGVLVAFLALALIVDIGQVHVKAKTAEKMGPVGRGESIEARAVCLLAKGG